MKCDNAAFPLGEICSISFFFFCPSSLQRFAVFPLFFFLLHFKEKRQKKELRCTSDALQTGQRERGGYDTVRMKWLEADIHSSSVGCGTQFGIGTILLVIMET